MNERTLEGIIETRRLAERDEWRDYGLQARDDVSWLLDRLAKLTEAIDASENAEAAMIEEWQTWRRSWENNPVMAALNDGVVALRRIRYVIYPPPPKPKKEAA